MTYRVLRAGFILILIVGSNAWGQGGPSLTPPGKSFSAQELDTITRLQWMGLRLVKPAGLADIVGFYAYPADDVCNKLSKADHFHEHPVLIQAKGNQAKVWKLEKRLSSNTTQDRIQRNDVTEKNDDPVSSFCDKYKRSGASGQKNGIYYLGMSKEVHRLARDDFKDPTVFWSTIDAIKTAGNNLKD